VTLPSLLLARSGNASLALIATHWKTEGTCLVEILSPDRSHATVVQNGIWRLTSAEEGPCVLSLEIDDPGYDGWDGLLGKLQAEAVLVGASWGIDGWEMT
jgi:hypothetical protein